MATTMVSEENTAPSPRDFDDYRGYLQAFIAHSKRSNPRFSYRYFARRAGFASPNYLKLLAEGQRNLADRSIERVCVACDLRGKDGEAFAMLVRLDNSRSDRERNRVYAELQKLVPKPAVAVDLRRDQFELYSQWIGVLVLQMLALPDFRNDARWIAARIRGRIGVQKVQESLKRLARLGLVRAKEQRLEPVNLKLDASRDTPLAARNFHRAMLALSASALDSVPKSQRSITSVTVALSGAQYDDLCQRVEAFRAELLEAIDESKGDFGVDKEVYHIGFCAVPMTKKREK